jgi:hypothetical protein
MTNTILTFPIITRSPLSCTWVETGNPNQPLTCIWLDRRLRSVSTNWGNRFSG